METNDNISGKNDLGSKKWNNLQEKQHINEELNEGFCNDNIPRDYDPSKGDDGLRRETDVDEKGNPIQVDRARFPDDTPEADTQNPARDDNRIIENPESLQNRDRNYDLDPNRYPPDDPENKTSRGNIDFGK